MPLFFFDAPSASVFSLGKPLKQKTTPKKKSKIPPLQRGGAAAGAGPGHAHCAGDGLSAGAFDRRRPPFVCINFDVNSFLTEKRALRK